MVRRLGKADPTIKAEIYKALGVRAIYRPATNTVDLVAQPVSCAKERVGGPTTTRSTRAPWRWVYAAA
jgi:hypothetical protein